MPDPKMEVVNCMPNHHEIQIHLIEGASVQTDASPVLYVGDTVRYSSPDGKVRVNFPSSSPFATSELHSAHTHTVKNSGHFQFQCFVTPTGKTEEIGWDKNNAQAGGEHDVIPSS
jgi:hypothetical protein